MKNYGLHIEKFISKKRVQSYNQKNGKKKIGHIQRIFT